MDISLGLDIATSISIIGAAISFGISQAKSRKQKVNQYIFENEKDLVNLLSTSQIEIRIYKNNMAYNLGNGGENPNFMIELHKFFSELKIKVDIKQLVFKELANKDENAAVNTLLRLLEDTMKQKPEAFAKNLDNTLDQIDSEIGHIVKVMKRRIEY